jgi:hypothetical protein
VEFSSVGFFKLAEKDLSGQRQDINGKSKQQTGASYVCRTTTEK